MKLIHHKILSYVLAAVALAALCVHSCGIYSFTGTSIQPDVKTVTINYFEYKALKVNPTLSNSMTESLKDKFRKMTRLEQVDMDGDIEITGAVTGYDVRAMAITADEVAAQNRLTVTVKIDFTNRKYPEDDFQGKSFSAYADYDSTQSLDAVEGTLCDEIKEKGCVQCYSSELVGYGISEIDKSQDIDNGRTRRGGESLSLVWCGQKGTVQENGGIGRRFLGRVAVC